MDRPMRLADATGGNVSVSIDGWISDKDGNATGSYGLHPGLRFAAGGGTALLNQLSGLITVLILRLSGPLQWE